MCFAVASSLTLEELITAGDYSLAEAARPAIGGHGTFTVAIAIIATASGLLASIFAVSRMLAMLTDMKLIPHSHFGMPGDGDGHRHPLGRLASPEGGGRCERRRADRLIVGISLGGIGLVFGFEYGFLRRMRRAGDPPSEIHVHHDDGDD